MIRNYIKTKHPLFNFLTIHLPGIAENKQHNRPSAKAKIIITLHKEYSVTLVLADSDYVLLAQKMESNTHQCTLAE